MGRLLQASVHLVVQRREVLQRRLWLSQVVQGDLERRQNPAVEFVQDREKRCSLLALALDRLAVDRLGCRHVLPTSVGRDFRTSDLEVNTGRTAR